METTPTTSESKVIVKLVKQPTHLNNPFCKSNSCKADTFIINRSIPDLASYYYFPVPFIPLSEQTNPNLKFENNTIIDCYVNELFDDFLFIEIEKLLNLVQMFIESDFSCNSTFGEIIYNAIKTLELKLRQAQFHIGSKVGDICVVQSNHNCSLINSGTVIDAGYWDKAKRIMVADKVKEIISREIDGGVR